MLFGDQTLLKVYPGDGCLLAYLRNLPEMDQLYNGYCFEKGSRGRGNGKGATSPLCRSNIWIADEHECIVIHQTEKGMGPLRVKVYSVENPSSIYLSDQVWNIIRKYNLPSLFERNN